MLRGSLLSAAAELQQGVRPFPLGGRKPLRTSRVLQPRSDLDFKATVAPQINACCRGVSRGIARAALRSRTDPRVTPRSRCPAQPPSVTSSGPHDPSTGAGDLGAVTATGAGAQEESGGSGPGFASGPQERPVDPARAPEHLSAVEGHGGPTAVKEIPTASAGLQPQQQSLGDSVRGPLGSDGSEPTRGVTLTSGTASLPDIPPVGPVLGPGGTPLPVKGEHGAGTRGAGSSSGGGSAAGRSLTTHVASSAVGAAAGTAATLAALARGIIAAVGLAAGSVAVAAGAIAGAVLGEVLIGEAREEDLETDRDVERGMEEAAERVVQKLRAAKAEGGFHTAAAAVAAQKRRQREQGGEEGGSGGAGPESAQSASVEYDRQD